MNAIPLIQELIESSFGKGKPFQAEIEFDPKPREHGACNYRFWLDKYLIDISAWDHAFCLDILVLLNDESTEEPVWSAVGACDTVEGFEARFAQLVRWLEEQKS